MWMSGDPEHSGTGVRFGFVVVRRRWREAPHRCGELPAPGFGGGAPS